MSWLWIAACSRPVVCGDDIPITGRPLDEGVEAELRQTIDDFERWTGEPVCLREIQAYGRDRDGLAGSAFAERRRVILSVDTEDPASVVLRHELCHLFDVDHRITDAHPDVFTPPAGTIDPERYPTAADQRRERFAEVCEVGPVYPPLVAAVEASCGDPTGQVAQSVWRFPPWPGGPVQIVTPRVERETVVALEEVWQTVGDHLLESVVLPTVWLPLDDALVPQALIATDRPAFEPDHGTIAGEGELWHVRQASPAQRVQYDGTATETALEVRPWRGGWHADRLWLWDADDPEADVVEATGDGEVLAHHPPLDPDAMRRTFVVWDDRSAVVLVDESESRVVGLTDGEPLAELPTPMVPRRRIDGTWIGDYAYVLGPALFVPSVDIPPNFDMGQITGHAWVTDDGQAYASSPCLEDEDSGDGPTAAIPTVEFDGIRTIVHRDTVTWPL